MWAYSCELTHVGLLSIIPYQNQLVFNQLKPLVSSSKDDYQCIYHDAEREGGGVGKRRMERGRGEMERGEERENMSLNI